MEEYSADNHALTLRNAVAEMLSTEDSQHSRDLASLMENTSIAEIQNNREIKRLITQELQPGRYSEIPGFDIYALYRPMNGIGGDFYNITVRGRVLELVIADVSGHDLPSALYSLIAKREFEKNAKVYSTGKILESVNSVLCESFLNYNYVTAFIGLIDMDTGVMTYSCAGHFPPLVFKKTTGDIHELHTRGSPITSSTSKRFSFLPVTGLFFTRMELPNPWVLTGKYTASAGSAAVLRTIVNDPPNLSRTFS